MTSVHSNLDHALAYAARGFSVHWLRERSKAPVDKGWSTAPVHTAAQLIASFKSGYNVGLRLGEPSKVAGLYLHVIDVDIRVDELADEAMAALAGLFPGYETWPTVASGSGGASRHFYFLTDKPFSSKRVATSEGKHRRDKADPKTGKVKGGWSYDWEIELFGTGKQVAMPPSIHPDTGKPYRWEREFDFDLIDLGVGPVVASAAVESLGVVDTTTYAYESREPLEFKPGQLEAELDLIPVSDLHYDDWIRLGQALHHQFGGSQGGFDLWLKHTRRSTKFTGDDQVREMRRTKWKSFGKYRGAPVTMGTVRVWAQEARNDALIASFDEEEDEEDLIGPAPAAEKDGIDLIGDPLAKRQDLEWTSLLELTETSAIKPTLHNAALIFINDPRTAGLVHLNEFTSLTVLRGVPGRKPGRTEKGVLQLSGPTWTQRDPINGSSWGDQHDHAVRRVFEAPKTQGGYSLRITDRDMRAAVDLAARASPFHPVLEYLERLTWDGRPRVDTLFIDYVGAEDTAYVRQVAHMFLAAAVTRVHEPGHKFDFAPILEGKQGKRKSTFIRVLAKHWPGELEGDFGDPKFMVEQMEGGWILEIPELSALSRGDVRAVKAFMSREVDKVRLSYARRAQDFPRQSVFIGSTNDQEYLRDDTGGRRFWPIETRAEEIDTDRLAADIDQIWAEALTIYRQMRAAQPKGTLPLYLVDDAAREMALKIQEDRRIETAEDGLVGQIEAWLDKPMREDFEDEDDLVGEPPKRRERVWLRLIWDQCLGGDPRAYDDRRARELGRVMNRIAGWKSAGTLFTGTPLGYQKCWLRLPAT